VHKKIKDIYQNHKNANYFVVKYYWYVQFVSGTGTETFILINNVPEPNSSFKIKLVFLGSK